MYLVQTGNSSPDTVKSFVCSLDVHTQTSESAGTGHSTRRWAVDLDPLAETRHRPRPITSNASARQQPTAAASPAHTQGSRQSKRRVEITAWNKTKRKHIVSFQVLVGLNIFQHVGETFFESETLNCILSFPDVDQKIWILKTCRICHSSSSGVI